ncbi:putative ribosomal RNA-processing protein 17 [Amylocarpus encephaloides]|uniref:Ribosomal RNA-processing protein 17 n=1 Tax=Amylocarpus encephaloides TaxID=45428 RepID=A0A9P7YAH7_9HELO|nr:putative ribosomal RNA-processing protein 17 [Amylocarpus encephaloides]
MDAAVQAGIFRAPRPKKSVLPPLSRSSKKRKIEHKIEEISFNNDARADYLSGFHKRKVARAKLARAEAEKKEKEEKVQMRKQLREERKQELEEHVEAVNRLLKDMEPVVEGLGEEGDSWEGIEDEPVVEPVDHEEEYVDEDKYTVVTVEEVDISKAGISKIAGQDSEEDEEVPKLVDAEEKNKKVWPKKPRKQKFRYETKTERKLSRAKQKAGNKGRADARRGNG